MKAREYLRQARIIEASVMATEARMIRYARAAEGLPPHSRAAKAYGRMVADMGTQATKLRDWMRELERILDALPDERHRYILRRRFCDGCNLTKISRDMHYSYEHTQKLSMEALREFTRIYEQKRK